MIEWRWVVSNRNDNEPVLQYRTFIVGTDAGGALTLCGSPGWTDWQTVPTVTAEEAAP